MKGVFQVFCAIQILFYFCETKNSQDLVVSSILAIFNQYFVEKYSKLQLITYGNDNSSKVQDLVSNLLAKVNVPVLLEISEQNEDNLTITKLKSPSIIFCESFSQFEKVTRNLTWQPYSNKRLPHLVYVPKISIHDIENIQDGFRIDKVNFLVKSNESTVELLTSYMFTDERCKTSQVRSINSFSAQSGKWKSKNFYPEKYRNFYGCSLIVLMSPTFEKMNFLSFMAFHLNFKPKIKAVSLLSFYGDPVVLHRTLAEAHDIALDMAFLRDDRLDQTRMLFIDTMRLLLPPGEPFTEIERLLHPFDKETWACLIATFVLTLIVIQIINRCSIKVQIFVYGQTVMSPSLNLISTFLAGYQYQLPERNFARFQVMLYIFWSLIFRTCYQSKMFEFLQLDLRHPGIEEITEDYRECKQNGWRRLYGDPDLT